MKDIPCLIICPADDDRQTEWCLLTRRTFKNYDEAKEWLDGEQKAFPGGRCKNAKITECYFGTDLYPASGDPCPTCGEGILVQRTYRKYRTAFDKSIVVPNAKIQECQVCGERVYSAVELERWKQIKEQHL